MNYIAKLRKRHHLSQQKLADLLGVRREQISRWETESHAPSRMSKILIRNIRNTLRETEQRNRPANKGTTLPGIEVGTIE